MPRALTASKIAQKARAIVSYCSAAEPSLKLIGDSRVERDAFPFGVIHRCEAIRLSSMRLYASKRDLMRFNAI